MVYCKSSIKHEFKWINLFNSWFLLVIILLTTNINAVLSWFAKTTDNSSYCDSHKTCTQCTKAENCSWLFNDQKCNDAKSNFSNYLVVYSEESCPQFDMALSKIQQNDPYFSITISILNQTESLQTHLANSNISCNVENTIHQAFLSDGKTITCNSNITNIYTNRGKTRNSLNIFNFTLTMNGIQLQFDNPKDYYITVDFPTCVDIPCADSFWNDELRKYYCIWCMSNEKCGVNEKLSTCDVRTIKDNMLITKSVPNIEIKGSDIVISHYAPTLALSVETIIMSISIKNHKFLNKNKMTVIVAGRKCENPNIIDDNEVTCTVSKGKINDVSEGPVVVMYNNMSSTNYILKSKNPFKFVNPTLDSFEPKCSSVSGNNIIKINGTFFNVSRNIQVWIEEIVCEIQEFDYDHISCLTGQSDKPQENVVVTIKFNNKLIKKLSGFAYVNSPTLENRQNITGIASGGTKIQIKGNFVCVKTPKINVNYKGLDIFENCELIDERNIVCVTPKLERKPDRIFPMSIPFRLHMEFSGRLLKSQELHYQLYPDPIFLNFEVNGTTIRINGMYLNTGYRPDDLSIQVQNFTDRCKVLFAEDSYIFCQVPSTLLVDSVQGLIIVVGQSLKTIIGKKFDPVYSRQFQIATVLSGISIISVFVALVFGLLFCYKIILTNSKQQTEKRYMEELRNITAGMDDKRY